MLGEKKYSPPFDITQSVGNFSGVFTSFAFAPTIERSPALGAWPMMGSCPGFGFFPKMKSSLLAQAKEKRK